MNFPYSNTNKRYHTLDYFFKQKFGTKVCKISLNGGFTCPNIDGTKSTSGCIYCSKSGSGEYGGNPEEDLITQFNTIKKVMDRKWPNSKYIGYFQARTNTYAPVSDLKAKYEPILKQPNVVGLAIATRPDCITDECLDYLEDLNKRTFLTVELGLQTIHEKTSILINRCHDLKCFEDMVKKLQKRKIFTVVHIINGLPYETEDMMIETALERHFEIEKENFQKGIKTLALFFIDDISAYRKTEDGKPTYILDSFERIFKDKLRTRIVLEEGEYKEYLLESLSNISKCHCRIFFSR